MVPRLGAKAEAGRRRTLDLLIGLALAGGGSGRTLDLLLHGLAGGGSGRTLDLLLHGLAGGGGRAVARILQGLAGGGGRATAHGHGLRHGVLSHEKLLSEKLSGSAAGQPK